MTGGRVKRIQEYVKDEDDFLLTYGDGLCNVKIDQQNFINLIKRLQQ